MTNEGWMLLIAYCALAGIAIEAVGMFRAMREADRD